MQRFKIYHRTATENQRLIAFCISLARQLSQNRQFNMNFAWQIYFRKFLRRLCNTITKTHRFVDLAPAHAFTMAEAVLVMTILGIIATIMISTLKPAEFKDNGLRVLAKKVLSEIDTATTQILLNHSSTGKMSSLYELGTNNIFSVSQDNNHDKLAKLYKHYLSATRKQCDSDSCPCNKYNAKFYLKGGTCIGITTGEQNNQETIIPGELSPITVNAKFGIIFFDVNAEQEPNTLNKDQFLLPLSSEGIDYDAEESGNTNNLSNCPEHCLSCDSNGKCSECENGYMVDDACHNTYTCIPTGNGSGICEPSASL